ncbi:MAG: choice-of-anchor L domain-containing protein [Thainema sp.]
MSPTSTIAIPLVSEIGSLDHLMQSNLNAGLSRALDTLQNWAQTHSFADLLVSFDQGDVTDSAALQSLHQAWQQGDFSQLPTIQILSAEELQGAQGAFSSSTQTIYLSSTLIESAQPSSDALAQVFLEEIGHFVDAQVNLTDSPGDEGAVFAAQVQDIQISDAWLTALQSENDSLTLHLNGQTIEAEAMVPYAGDNLDQFQAGLDDFLTTLEDTIAQVIAGQELPLIGSALETVGGNAQTFVADMRTAIADQLASLPELTTQALEDALNQALGPGGLGILDALTVNETADNLQFDITLSRDLVELGSDQFDLSLGDTGLSLNVNGNTQLDVDLDLHLLLGLNSEGFYVDTAVEDELGINLTATIPDLEATGTLGFLQVDVEDNGSNLSSGITVDLQDSADAGTDLSLAEFVNLANTLEASINGSATFNANVSSGTTISALPSIGTNLVLDWQFLDADLNSFQTAAPTIAMNGVSLDVGSFFGGFVGPIFEGITTALEPVMPLVELLQTEIPILDKRIIDVAKALAEAGLGDFSPETIEFIDYVGYIAQIIDLIGSLSVEGSTITLGDFNVVDGDLQSLGGGLTPLEQLSGINESTSEFSTIINDNVRFEFPLLTQPESLIGLFLGQNADIFRLELPTIGFGVQYETQIPIFGPINLTVGGALGAAANLSFGFDTYGIAQFAEGGFTDPALIAQGFFVGSPLNPGTPPAPIDPNELFTFGLGTGVSAGVGIDLGLISTDITAGLVAQLFLNLNGDDEGKVRIEDFEVPACLLEALGKLDAVVAAKLQIGFGAFSIRKRIELVRETLLDFRAGCSGSTEDHQQATVGDDGTATLSVGEDAANLTDIDVEGIEADEVVTVTHISGVAGDETIAVEAYGASWTYENVSSIFADAGDGNDIIELVGVRSAAHLIGGAGDDQLLGGQNNDLLEGGTDSDYLSGGAGDDELYGGDGDDFLEGGAGNDLLDGGEGTDGVSYSEATSGVQIDLPDDVVIDGDGTQDTLISIEQFELSNHDDTFIGSNSGNIVDGLAGDDVINGGAGDDFLIGGAGADIIDGGGGEDATSYLESKAGVQIDLETGDVFSGGGSDADGDVLNNMEHVQGTYQDDILRGNSAENILVGAGGDDTLEGRGNADTLYGDSGNDTAEYIDSPTGVTVSLVAESEGSEFSVVGQGGHAQGDRLAMATDHEGNISDRNSIENLTGSLHNDSLTGDGGRNTLSGLAGNDTLNGGEGNDHLIGGAGADHHNGGGGLDWADYSDSNAGVTVNLTFNVGLGGHAQGDTFASVENLKGSNWADTLRGNGVNNDINPGLSSIGPGVDFVHGGGETDTMGDRLILDYSSSGSSLQGGYDYVAGSSDSGEFIGNVEFDDIERLQIVGSYLNDTIRGGGGDDYINGGAGNDTILGGQGRNFLYGDDGNDTITNLNNAFGEVFYNPANDEPQIFWVGGGAGIDTFSGNFRDRAQDIVLTSLNPDQENPEQFFTLGDGSVIHQFERFQDIQTGSGDDQLTQLGRVNNDFRTGAGDDMVNTGLGLDYADGGIDGFSSGEHVIYGDDLLIVDYSEGDIGGGIVSEVGGDPFETSRYSRNAADGTTLLDEVEFVNFERVHLDGTQHSDAIVGLIGADELRGHDGNDSLVGRSGHDHIWGGAGDDSILGGSGNDELHGGSGNDVIIDDLNEDDDEGGQDQLFGDDGDDWLLGGNGNDALEGGNGNDILIGGAQNDTLNGGAGNDILIGINFGQSPFPADPEIDTMTGGQGADQFWLGDGLFSYYDDGQLFSGGSQNQAVITDFTLQEGDVIFLHGAASDYTLQESNGSTRILRNGFIPELIGTVQGVTGLDLNDGAFQYFDDQASEENMSLLLPAVQQIQAANMKLTAEPDTQAALLLPAIQAAREAASSSSSAPSLEQGLAAPSQDISSVQSPHGSQVAPSQTPVLLTAATEAEAASNANSLNVPAAQAQQAGLVQDDSAFSITQQNNPYVLLNSFLGDTTGLTILNAQTSGDARAFGTFQYDPFGLGNGIVLSTGKVIDLVGENQVDGGFVGNANIPLDFVKLGTEPDLGFSNNLLVGNVISGSGNNSGLNVDDFVANPIDPDPPAASTAISRADLSSLNQIQSLTITDSGLGIGGAGGERSGFDLVGIKISNVLIDDAASIDEIPGIDLFDFSPLSTFFNPGTQRPSTGANFPEAADMFGSLHGQVNNAIATLSEFDFDGDTGFVSLGDGGSVGFNLTETINPDGPLYLYVGEAANNGESLNGQITASAQRINGQTELSTDFGLPGADGDTSRFSFDFEADGSTEQVFFRFVFASEEFVEYGGSSFNDAFSIKLNGMNLARLSDGAEANINNLVTNPFGNYHPDFVHNSVGEGPASSETPLDGYTQVLTFAGPVQPNAINHLEIEVKDVGDGLKDTAIFLQAGSFGTDETPQGSITFFGTESVLPEGNSSMLNLKLNTVPTEKVKVTLDPDQQIDLGNGAGKPLAVFFTPEDALSNRQIKFTAYDDKLVEGAHSGLIIATIHSADPSYSDVDSLTIEQFIIDNDKPFIGIKDPILGGRLADPLVGAPSLATLASASETATSSSYSNPPIISLSKSLFQNGEANLLKGSTMLNLGASEPLISSNSTLFPGEYRSIVDVSHHSSIASSSAMDLGGLTNLSSSYHF